MRVDTGIWPLDPEVRRALIMGAAYDLQLQMQRLDQEIEMTEVAVPTMSVDDARRITERIRVTAHTARESIEKLHALVDEAKAGNAHVTLGYPSWTAYLADLFGDEPLRLARDQRKELVSYLSGEGMSTRAIAPIVGVDDSTVSRSAANAAARREPELEPEPEEPKTTIGKNGKTYTNAAMRAQRTEKVRELVAQGLNQREIGEKLGIARTTIADIFKSLRGSEPVPTVPVEPPSVRPKLSTNVSRQDKADRIRELASQGLSSHQMGDQVFGISARKIRSIAREFDIELPPDPPRRQSPTRSVELTADRIREQAAQGYSTRQIAEMFGMNETYIRDVAKRFEIEIPADKAINRTRRHNSNRIVQETINALAGLAIGIDLINYDDLDLIQVGHWATSLDESMKVLNQFKKALNKKVTE